MKRLALYLFTFFSAIGYLQAQSKAVKISYSLNIADSFQEKSDLSLLTEVFTEDDLSDFVDIWTGNSFTRVAAKNRNKMAELHLFHTQKTFLVDAINKQYQDISEQQSRRYGVTEQGNIVTKFKEKYSISYDQQIKREILGHICFRAVIHFPENKASDGSQVNKEVEVWYTKDFPAIFWSKFSYLSELPGAALKIQSEGLGLTARQITTLKNEDLLSQIPSSYKLLQADSEQDQEESPFEISYLGEGRYSYYEGTSALFGIQDSSGVQITKPLYKEIHGFKNQLAVVANKELKYGVINTQGQEVTNCIYEELIHTKEGLFIFEQAQKQGYLSAAAKPYIPGKFKTAYEFQGAHALVSDGTHMGIINREGEILVPLKYDRITAFNETVAIVIINHQYGLISLDGREIIAPKYDYLQFGNADLLLGKKGEKFGFLDFQGAVKIPFSYEQAQAFQQGKALVQQGQQHYYISKTGQQVN